MLPSQPRAQGSVNALPHSLAHLLCLPAKDFLSAPPPSPGRSPAPGEAKPASRPAGPIKLYDLRRRVTRGAEVAAGWTEVPAASAGSRVAAGRRGPGCSEAGPPLAPCRHAAMQGPGGNVSRGLPGAPASTVASGAGRCESGALMHSFGIFLQGLLGVVAFSTLMRESGTPAPPRPRVASLGPSPTPGTLLPVEFRPEDPALGLRCLPLPRGRAGRSQTRKESRFLILLRLSLQLLARSDPAPPHLRPVSYQMPA